MIKPWLSRNFLQGNTWSSVRDYPPKTKLPWLFNNFMEMEDIHEAHMEEPWTDPSAPTLPPNPDIPEGGDSADGDGGPEDPCTGDRTLWIESNPLTVDCDDASFSLLFSPDYQCIQLQQLFFDDDGIKLVDATGRNFQVPVNLNDVVEPLTLTEKCNEQDSITIAAIDCTCGGFATTDMWLENCGTDCDAVFMTGSSSIGANSSTKYTIHNFPTSGGQDFQWSVIGTGASIGQDGTLFTSNACGTIIVIFNSNCCGPILKYVKCTVGIWGNTATLCLAPGYSTISNCISFTSNVIRIIYFWGDYPAPSPPELCPAYAPPPCFSGTWDSERIGLVQRQNWICAP